LLDWLPTPPAVFSFPIILRSLCSSHSRRRPTRNTSCSCCASRKSHKTSSANSLHTGASIMTASALSNYMLSMPANLTLASDNARSACQPAAPPAAKPVKASRWGETKASASPPNSPSCLRARSTFWNEPFACSVPPKAPRRASFVSQNPMQCATRACRATGLIKSFRNTRSIRTVYHCKNT
jgi:hypothetical protein